MIPQKSYIFGAEEDYWRKLDSNNECDVTTENIDEKLQVKSCNWKENYGTLEDGEYRITIYASDYIIIVNFSVNGEGEIKYEDPYCISR